MIKWIYKDKNYTISPISLEDDIKLLVNIINQRKVVYNTKWDKCYYINSVGYTGKGNKLKVCIEDVYTNKKCMTCVKDLKLVIEDK
jgi:hypothetical protein